MNYIALKFNYYTKRERSFKMKKMVVLCLFVAVALGFTSCRLRNDPFPASLVTYFPYTENQQLVFANENRDTTCLTVTEVFVSGAWSCPFGQKCRPPIEMTVNATNDSILFNVFMSASYPKYLILDLKACDVYYYREFPGDPFSEQIISEIGDTIRLSKDNNEAIVVRYEGLVEFSDLQRNCTWKLVK